MGPSKPCTTDADESFPMDAIDPVVLALRGQTVFAECAAPIPLYQLSSDALSIPQRDSSIRFERVVGTEKRSHLFYLAHPENAQYRTDTPAYYLTSLSSKVGNIRFETTKPRLQKAEFNALLSEGRTASSRPLFGENEHHLFNIKPKWNGQYKWTDSSGREIAVEDGGGQLKLVVTMSMHADIRDALVALWVLRLWYDTAESKQARRECMLVLHPVSCLVSG